MNNSSQIKERYLSTISKHWGWFLLWGILLVILGITAIGATTTATLISVVFLGTLILMSGIVIILDAFTFWWGKWGGFFLDLIIGILYFAVGISLIQSPLLGSISITLFLGIFYLTLGIFRTVYSLSTTIPNKGWNLFNALMSLLLGVLILANWPASSLFVIGFFVGIDLLFSGWSYIMMSLSARRHNTVR